MCKLLRNPEAAGGMLVEEDCIIRLFTYNKKMNITLVFSQRELENCYILCNYVFVGQVF